MKNIKLHLISIMIIILMLLFALGTSYRIYGELTVINNTKNILNLKIVRFDYSSDKEFIEEFTLQSCQNNKLKTFYGMNTFANRGLGIKNFIIYNENNEIIKEYGEIHYENIPELNFYLKKTKRRIYYYIFNH